MSEVKRYMPVARYIGDNKYEADMLPLDGFPAKVIKERGRFVLHSDYAALESELAALRASIVALAEDWERVAARAPEQVYVTAWQETLAECATKLRQLGEGNGRD